MNNEVKQDSNNNPVTIGHYQIKETLGKGSSSVVYKAYDPRLSRFVAIKLLHAYEHNDIQQEAKILASINHSHVVAIYDVVSYNAQLALVMEYLPSETLADRMMSGSLDLKSSLNYTLEIAKGLQAIHFAGLVHQDIKAENIFFDDDGHLKVGDLGIAKPIEQSSQLIMAGSIYSLSPEQVKHEKIGSSSDLFSLGVLLYQMLTQRHPFSDCSFTQQHKADTNEKILDNILNAFPPPPNTGYKCIDELVMRLLSKSPEHRVASAQSLIVQIKSIITTELSCYDNNTIFQDNPVLEAARIKYEQKQTSKLNRIKWLSTIAFISIVFAGVWYSWPAQTRYVAVLNPRVSAGEHNSDIALIQASVNQATMQVIQSLKNTKMVASDEVSSLSQAPENIKQIQQITAADEVFFTQLSCLPDKCAVSFSRWQGSPATLMDQDQIQIPTERLLTISDDVKAFLINWLAADGKSDLFQPASEESVFRSFLELKSQYQKNLVTLPNYIKGLESIGEESCKAEEICYVLLQAYRRQYLSLRESIWLEKARKTVVSADNLSNRMILSIAEIELAAQNFDTSDEWLKQLEDKHSVDDSVKSLRARWYFAQGMTIKGKALLLDLVNERPAAKHLFNYALMLFKSGEMDESLGVLKQLTMRVPNHIKGLELYGILQYYKGEWGKVINTYQTLIGLNQAQSPITQSNLGFAYLMESEGEKALKHLNKAFEISPSNPQILINLADAESIFGEQEVAFRHYEKVIELVNRLPNKTKNDLLTLAQAYAHTNRKSEARGELMKVEGQLTQDPYTFYYLSLVYSILGEVPTASAYKNEALASGIPEQWYDLIWFQEINKA